MTFTALVLEDRDGNIRSSLQQLDEATLPPGDVTVRVSHSTLNYKDGLILNGLGRLVRKYPHVPGVDFAGEVEESSHPAWKRGDKASATREYRAMLALDLPERLRAKVEWALTELAKP